MHKPLTELSIGAKLDFLFSDPRKWEGIRFSHSHLDSDKPHC